MLGNSTRKVYLEGRYFTVYTEIWNMLPIVRAQLHTYKSESGYTLAVL